jgi:hypothetical protein
MVIALCLKASATVYFLLMMVALYSLLIPTPWKDFQSIFLRVSERELRVSDREPRPCRIAITNSVAFHYETLESIASQLPTKYIHFPRATCDINSLVFDYHIFAAGLRVQSWTYYFHLAMQDRDVTHLKAKNDPTKKRAIGNLYLHSKLPASRILSLDGYDAYVEATCYCRPGDVTIYGNHSEWLSQNDYRTCIFHVRCPSSTLENHPRTVWVSPHVPEYYIPSVLPGFREKPGNTRHKNPELCVVGAPERRDFNLLAHYYQNHTIDRFQVHIYGAGNYPDSMKPYRSVVKQSELSDYQTFHDHVGRCDAILALLSKKSTPSYFDQKLTGIIPILLAYKQPAIIHEDLYKLYKEQLPGNVSYETHSDEVSSFVDALDRFLDKISE